LANDSLARNKLTAINCTVLHAHEIDIRIALGTGRANGIRFVMDPKIPFTIFLLN
jgi:hypothetical protein